MEAEKQCKNCGAQLNTPYCGACGQAGKVGVPSLWAVTADLLDDLFSLDSRIWRTLFRLMIQPGELTREYLAGRRLRYLSPLRMYLVVSLFYFLIASVIDADQGSQVVEDIDEIPFCNLGSLPPFLDTPQSRARLENVCLQIVADRGNSLRESFSDNIPLMMFLVIPLVALVMKLLYLRSPKHYVEHLLFLAHFHAFCFAIITLITLAAILADAAPILRIPIRIVISASWIYIPIYFLLSILRVYGERRVVTSLKYLSLLASYALLLPTMFLIGLAYTALSL